MSRMFEQKRTRRSGRAPALQVWRWAMLSGALGCNLDAIAPEDGVIGPLLSDEALAQSLAPSLSPEQFDAAVLAADERPESPDRTGGAWRIIDVPGPSGVQIVRSPAGWFALSSRGLGDAKAPSGWRSALYRSTDGVHWVSVPLEPHDDELVLFRLAYGAGHYVLMGDRPYEGRQVVWTSTDAEHWTERALPASQTSGWLDLSYAQQRFFVFAFNQLGISETGKSWKRMSSSLIQYGAAAYGNGVYLLAGSGPMWTSRDGWSWQEHALDCGIPGACFPGIADHQGIHPAPIFVEGRFYSGELSSVDGEHWESNPGRSPQAYVSGRFLGDADVAGLAAWVSGGDAQALHVIHPARDAVTVYGSRGLDVRPEEFPPPDTVDVSFDDGLTCESASCVFVDHQLLLVPPVGTPPLIDRVPRGADGTPLLSGDCPFSSMIFCDDYTARSGCACQPDAPMAPEQCGDVSKYRCAGQFTPRADEWQLEELAQGGCSCDG